MGFGYYMRAPYTVQADNGTASTFDTIKERYENTKPLIGKRAKLNIRPNGDRKRAWERIIKVDENNYYLTNNAYAWIEKMEGSQESHGRKVRPMISFTNLPETNSEIITIHTVRKNWGEKADEIYPRDVGIPSNFYFYHFNLPTGLGMEKFYSKNYVKCATDSGWKFYTLDKGDIKFIRRKDEKYYKPLEVHREYHRTLDKDKTKAIRNEVKSFIDYAKAIIPLAPDSGVLHSYYSPLNICKDVHGYNWCPKDLEKYKELTWREFLCTPDGEPSELWFEYVSYLKHKHTNERYIAKTDDIPAHYEKTFKFDNARKSVYNTLYQAERAFKEEVVELGVRCFDKYRNW